MSGMTYFDGEKCKADSSYSNAINKILKDPDKKKKILYGSDYYPVIPGLCDADGKYQTYFDIVRKSIGDDNLSVIASENPKKF